LIVMTHSSLRSHLAIVPLLAALVLAGCASAPTAEPSALPTIPAAYKEGDGRWTVAPPAEAQPRGAWWKAFSDPVLDELAERAGRNNTSIAQAAARLAQAKALLRSTDADRSVQVGVGAGVARQGGGVANAAGTAGTLASAGANLSYEVDLFGRLSKASRAASLDASSREALLQSTRLLVQSNVAQTYFALRALDNERSLVRDTVAAYADTLRLTESRFRAGDVAELDVVRVRTEVAATQSEALALERRRAELEHALAVLIGELPANFAVAEIDWAGPPPAVPPGLPSSLLARRPDVSAAQSAMLAAQARVGVAQTAWFPSVALTASGGYASPELGDLFKWSARAWGVGALLSLPLFDGGRREAGVQGASAQLDGAAASYREQVLVAFKDVEDQLSSLRLLGAQADVQAQAVASASRATVLSDSRYRNGLVSQLELLDARRREASNRREALQVRAAQYQATVGLIRALGGGWGTAHGASGVVQTRLVMQ
jgi:multidrug efflux system outer membrane protein